MHGRVTASRTVMPQVEPMSPEHWPEVRRIYLEGIATGHATFETEAPSWEKWDRGHLPTCRLIAREESKLLGWAALSRVSSRRMYAGVAEVSVYVAELARGNGKGKSLLSASIESFARCGMWNSASRHLCGERGKYCAA